VRFGPGERSRGTDVSDGSGWMVTVKSNDE
jgi:hypothetical protein